MASQCGRTLRLSPVTNSQKLWKLPLFAFLARALRAARTQLIEYKIDRSKFSAQVRSTRQLKGSHTRPSSFVLKMDRGLGGGAYHVHQCGSKRWGGEQNVGIVGETEAFFWNPEHISIQPGIPVFVVYDGHTVVSRGQLIPEDSRLAHAGGNRGGAGTKGLFGIFRPSLRRFKDDRTYDSIGVPKPVHVNSQGAITSATLVRAAFCRAFSNSQWTGQGHEDGENKSEVVKNRHTALRRRLMALSGSDEGGVIYQKKKSRVPLALGAETRVSAWVRSGSLNCSSMRVSVKKRKYHSARWSRDDQRQ
jgi:hypothetical protein